MQSFLRYAAKSTQGLEKYTLMELKQLGVKAKINQKFGFNEIEFRANHDKLQEIISQCRTIENLNVQLGSYIIARGEKELEQNLKKLPWEAFIPTNNLQDYEKITVKCKSINSNLYHEKMVQELLQKYIELIPIRKQWHKVKMQGVSLEDIQRQQLIQTKKINSKNDLQILNTHSQIENKIKQTLPQINIYLQKNKAKIMVQLNKESMHKHGLKQFVGWGPIKESLVAACLMESKILQDEKQLKIWDPFCGSGTILLEALSQFYRIPIDQSKNFNFNVIPSFQSLQPIKQNYHFSNNIELRLIGSDISEQELNTSIMNFQTNVLSQFQFENQSQIQSSLVKNVPFIKQLNHEEKIYLINGDFEKIAHQVLNNFDQFNILTNLPYGIRSSNYIQKNELEKTYNRFSKFLKKNYKKLNKVFVITTENFINLSQKTDLLKWTLKMSFDNNGINVGLYQLEGEIDHTELQIIQDAQIIIQQEKQKLIEEYKEKKQQNILAHKLKFQKDLNIAKSKINEKIIYQDNKILKQTPLKRTLKGILRKKREEFVKKKQSKRFIDGFKDNLKQEQQQQISIKNTIKEKNSQSILKQVVGQQQKQEAIQKIQQQLDKIAQKKINIKEQNLAKKSISKSSQNKIKRKW